MMAFLPPKFEILERTDNPETELLERLIASMWDKPDLIELMEQIDRGPLEAYKTPNGLILLETVDWSRGRELSLYGMVGRDILRTGTAEAIVRDLKKLAAYYGCSMIGGVGIPQGWKRAAPKLGFQPVSTHYVMELDDGR